MDDKKLKSGLIDASTNDYHALDPLGEIRNRSKELWEEHGSPPDKSWKDFIHEAESELLCDGSTRTAKKPRNKIQGVPVEPEIREARLIKDSPLLHAVSLSTPNLINQHEAFCIARLLNQSSFKISGSEELLQPTPTQIAEILSLIVGEYPENAFGDSIDMSPMERALEDRVAYWKEQLQKWFSEDVPLNFSDRNTMQRFHLAMLEEGSVTQIELR